MFVADDLEQVRGERASSELARSLLMAPPAARPLVLLDRLRVHPRPIVVHPLAVDLLHVVIREDLVGVLAPRAARVFRTLLLDDP